MQSTLNEHNLIGSYSEMVIDTAEQSGYDAAKAGMDRKAPKFISVRGRQVALTGFTRTDWFRGFDVATSEMAQAEIEEVITEQAELVCDTNNEAFESYLDELVQESQSIVHVEQLTRQQAKQLLEQAGFTGCGTMTIQEFGLPRVYSAWCSRGTVATRVPLDQLISTVRGWIEAEQSFQSYRKIRMAQYA